MMKDFKLNMPMADREDVYNIAHAIEDELYDYAEKRGMTTNEFADFVKWSLKEIVQEVSGDFGAAYHMNEIRDINFDRYGR